MVCNESVKCIKNKKLKESNYDKDLVEIVPPKYTDAFGLDNGNFQLGVIHCVGNTEVTSDLSELTNWYKENRKKNPPILY